MAAGDVYRFTATVTSQTYINQNTIAVQTLPATDPDATARQLLADDFMAIWRARQKNGYVWQTWQLRQLWGDGMSLVASECRREGGRVYGTTFTAPTTGGNTTDNGLPPQNAMVVTLQTGLIGRRKRGRIYGFGLTEVDQSDGKWETATLTAITGTLNTFFNKYKSGGTSPNYQLGVWSERVASGCVWDPASKRHVQVDTPNPDQAFTPVSAYTLRNVVYTQRKRTLGVGF